MTTKRSVARGSSAVGSVGGCISAVLIPVALAALGYILIVHQLQEKLIYMPRDYASHLEHYRRARETARSALLRRLGGGVEDIAYKLPEAHGGSAQTAYFLAPASARLRGDRQLELWIAAGGNAGLALDWIGMAVDYMAGRGRKKSGAVAFYLVDYPGYGANGGEPSPEAMLAGNRAALRALDKHLTKIGVGGAVASPTPSFPPYRLHYLAHSIGCAVALAHSADSLEQDCDHPYRRVAGLVLVSPFTTMLEMARRALPIPVPWLEMLLRHPFDNPREMARIARAVEGKKRGFGGEQTVGGRRAGRQRNVSIAIVHGDRDGIVPVEMGRKMAELGRKLAEGAGEMSSTEIEPGERRNTMVEMVVQYVEVQGADHNRILEGAKRSIFRAMGWAAGDAE